MKTRLAVTPGEPAGIGPDLLIELAQSRLQPELVAFADPELLQERARLLGLPLKVREYGESGQPPGPGELTVYPVPLATAATPGQLDKRNAQYVLKTLELATQACLSGECQALVTGPVHKGIINEAGISFSGHTEFLAAETNTPKVVMMLATEGLRVALATTHLPLSEVSNAITKDSLAQVISILHSDLQNKFGIARPRILVCGLNPHAGEGGHLGREEIDTIEPVVSEYRAAGMDIRGPLPADTLFTHKYLEQADAVLAMYHDQGLPVLKYKAFGSAVNITLGLPVIRTSVDHGTALDLAATGQADCGSMKIAVEYAMQLAQQAQR